MAPPLDSGEIALLGAALVPPFVQPCLYKRHWIAQVRSPEGAERHRARGQAYPCPLKASSRSESYSSRIIGPLTKGGKLERAIATGFLHS